MKVSNTTQDTVSFFHFSIKNLIIFNSTILPISEEIHFWICIIIRIHNGSVEFEWNLIKRITIYMRYVSFQLTSHAFRIRVKFDGLAMVKRIRGILSQILVRENYFFDRRGGARSSRKVGSGLTEGISRYKAELYTTRLRSNLFV